MPDLYPNYLIYRIRVCEHPSCCNPVRASANTEVSVGRAIAINSRLCPGSRTETCQVPQGKRGIHAPVLPAPLAAFAAASLLFAGCRWPPTHHAWPVGSETARGSRRPTPGVGTGMMRNLPRVRSDPPQRGSAPLLSPARNVTLVALGSRDQKKWLQKGITSGAIMPVALACAFIPVCPCAFGSGKLISHPWGREGGEQSVGRQGVWFKWLNNNTKFIKGGPLN